MKVARFVLSLVVCVASLMLLASAVSAQNVCPTPSTPDVTTWHNDNCRTGWQQNESILTPTSLRNSSFGLLWKYQTAGTVDAEPLAVSGLQNISGCSTNPCSLVFIADEEDNVYAFDAASNTRIWSTNVATSVLGSYIDCSVNVYATSFPPCETNTPDGNTVGIMGTPVIDESDSLLYAVGAVGTSGNVAGFYIFAVAIQTGNVVAAKQIQGSVQGMSPGSSDSVKCTSTYPSSNSLTFDSGHVQRAALTLLNHVVYVAFSPGDHEWENGWVFGYSQASGGFTPTAVFATTPYGTGGGIWGSSAGPASDGTYLYTVSGNGTFDTASNGDPLDWGDSALKLLPPSSGEAFPVIDFYDPPDNLTYMGTGRCKQDEDFSSGGIMLFPEPFYYDENLQQYVNLSVNADKESKIFVIDRDNMRVNGTSGVQILGPFPSVPTNDPTQGYWNSPAYWKYWDSQAEAHYLLYYAASDGLDFPGAAPLPLYQFILPTSGSSGPLLTSQQGVNFNASIDLFCRFSPTPSVSSTNSSQGDGAVAGTGVLWAIETHRNIHNPSNCVIRPNSQDDEGSALHAYDATTMQELYNSASSLSSRLSDAHFNVPSVFQGRVYMGVSGGNLVYVFGLCSEGGGGACPAQ